MQPLAAVSEAPTPRCSMTACAATPRYLTAPTVWKRHGRWWILFCRLGNGRNLLPSPITPRELGDRGKPTNSWSVMAESGANLNLLPREILPGVLVCGSAAEVARTAARRFVEYAWQSIARH